MVVVVAALVAAHEDDADVIFWAISKRLVPATSGGPNNAVGQDAPPEALLRCAVCSPAICAP